MTTFSMTHVPRNFTHIKNTTHSSHRVICSSIEAASPILDHDVRIIYCTTAAALHDWPGHAECAERVPAILNALVSHNFASNQRVLQIEDFADATPEDIATVHSMKYIKGLERVSSDVALQGTSGTLVDSAPTYVTATTYKNALHAAGAAMELVDRIIAQAACKRSLAAFGICRPPGHHAIPTSAMGFCLMNNAAVAARHAQRVHGLQKIAIFDWDVHHGNGTQDVFENDPTVLFISTHQANSYPGTGKISEIGTGDGEGFTLNLPLPGDSGHYAAIASYEEIVEPAIRRFMPDMIIISAGYDGHVLDPLATLQYRSSTYHCLAKKVTKLAEEVCQGRLLFLLEGGYHLGALGESVASTFAGVLGEKSAVDSLDASMFRGEPEDKVRAALHEVKRIHGL